MGLGRSEQEGGPVETCQLADAETGVSQIARDAGEERGPGQSSCAYEHAG